MFVYCNYIKKITLIIKILKLLHTKLRETKKENAKNLRNTETLK